jgi:LacI family transcriptional regulator
MGTTIKDVAREAGVSQATAARALAGYGYASERARKKVLAAAERLGYRPHAVARALVSGSTRTLGLVVGDIENPFFALVARGMADVAGRRDYTLLLANSDEDLEEERRAVETLLARRVDGLAVAPTSPGSLAHLSPVAAHGTPLVVLDRPLRGLRVDTVTADNAGGAAAAVGHLIALGHRRIGVVSDSPEIGSTAERLRGFRAAMRAAGLEVDGGLVSVGGPSADDGYRSARTLLERRDRPSALFTANNLMTLGAVRALCDLGLHMPDDVALLGFDDTDWTTIVSPPLTVVAQPVYELGRVAGERLLLRCAGHAGAPRRIRLPTELVVRASCGERDTRDPKGDPSA